MHQRTQVNITSSAVKAFEDPVQNVDHALAEIEHGKDCRLFTVTEPDYSLTPYLLWFLP